MKLSKYIAGLQEFFKENGDLDCFYASDSEGNSYQQVGYTGSILFTMTPEAYNAEMYCPEDAAEYKDDELVPVCIIN